MRNFDYNVEDLSGETGTYHLHPKHNYAKTHHIKCMLEEAAVIPNIAGDMLPRRDSGDRNYYYSIMLTLFKPWRTGFDLKMKEESWAESFIEFQFNDRQNTLMDNFHL